MQSGAEVPSASQSQAQMQREEAEREHSRMTSNSTASSSVDVAVGPPKVGPSDFELLKVVGQGAFGKVAPMYPPSPNHCLELLNVQGYDGAGFICSCPVCLPPQKHGVLPHILSV